MNDNSSTLRQRELGKQLRGLRNPRGLTLDEVAQCLEWSATKISRFETGLRCPTLRDVRDLCYLYKVSEPGCVKLMALAQEAQKQGWWTEYDDLILDPFSGVGTTLMRLEASRCTSYRHSSRRRSMRGRQSKI